MIPAAPQAGFPLRYNNPAGNLPNVRKSIIVIRSLCIFKQKGYLITLVYTVYDYSKRYASALPHIL